MEKADTLVLFPLSQMGHLVPMIELAKRLLHHGLTIRVLLLELTFLNNDPINSYISDVKASHPSISFHHLHTITLPSPSSNPLVNMVETLRLSNPHILRYLRSTSPSTCALILDFFSGPVYDVVAKLQFPTYIFCTVSASTLSTLLYIPTLHSQSDTNFKDLHDTPLDFPCLTYPIPASNIPNFLLNHVDELSKVMLASFMRLPTLAKGILINSFQALEPWVLCALADGLCVPNREIAPIYSVGPITGSKSTIGPRHESLAWLDKQPSGSVVLLSFGSLGTFSEAQLREIAIGLERSRQRFLWVVRGPPLPGRHQKDLMSWTKPDLKALMPDGFEERTRESGLLVSSWAPQVELLEHEAVGGFVTHCGWNSTLEAIVAGIPMIAWPLYAEQKLTKLFLVKEVELAVDIQGDENGFVVAEEVEERVRWLMDTNGGSELRRKVADVGKKARDAVRDGGTSHVAIMKMLRSMRGDEEDGVQQH